jgi:hypothetical protein
LATCGGEKKKFKKVFRFPLSPLCTGRTLSLHVTCKQEAYPKRKGKGGVWQTCRTIINEYSSTDGQEHNIGISDLYYEADKQTLHYLAIKMNEE